MARPALLPHILLAASLAFLPLSAPFAASSGPLPTQTATADTGLSAAQDYLRHASISDLFERASSKIALRKSERDDVKAFAMMMVEDHAKTSETLRAAALRDGLAPGEAKLDAEQTAQLKELEAAAADKFDSLYLDMQVKGHTGALALHKDFAATDKDTALKSAAGEIAPLVQQHLDAAKKLVAVSKTGS